MKPRVAIIGHGKVGSAFGQFLEKAGYPIAGYGDIGDALLELTRKAELIFITTPDGIIEKVCTEIAEQRGFPKNSVVLHCSGALSSEILTPAREKSAFVGSLHPLQSFAAKTFAGNPFEGIIFAAEGDENAVETAKRAAMDLGAAQCIEIETSGKRLYHAAAVVASNYLVTLMNLSFDLLEASGISREDAFGVLSPLIRGTLANIEAAGIPDALTGPVARGDAETVAGHLQDMDEKMPENSRIYRLLGLYTLEIAKKKGDISPEAHARIEALFTGRSSI